MKTKSQAGAWRSQGALVALLLLAPGLHAGDVTQRLASGLEARVWSPWPETVQKGWAPIFVEIRSELPRELFIEVEARCGDWNSERMVQTRVQLPPEGAVALELLVPLGGDSNNQYYVSLSTEDSRAYFNDTVASSSASPGFRQVLLLGEYEPEAGAVERWSAALSTTTIGGTHRAVFVLGSGAPPAAPPPPNDVDVAHARFAGMPRHHAAYSSLDLVVLDPARGMPSEAQLAGLLAWVRTGGDLLVLGERARSAALGVPAFAAWMEPRFETNHAGHGTGAGGSEYRCGLGRLFVDDLGGELDDGSHVDWVREILGADASLTPENGPWRGALLAPAIPGLTHLPYRAFAALLILFALVIGPLNFLAVRKRKNPVLLLLTIPVIALVTTVALLAYGILFQGVDVKSASHSVAVLDQREHRSACVESRQFFAGLAPAAGLALGPGTIVHAMPADGSRSWGRRRFEVELESGTLLGGDYLPSRRATDQVLAVERAERARLEVRRGPDGLRVDNNLGVGVQALIVRDPEGDFYLLESPLTPGASAGLRKPDDAQALSDALNLALNDMRSHTLALTPVALPSTEAVPPGCYLARLERGPFRDDCGIEMNELAGTHVVLGVLPLEPEAWR